YRLVGGCSTACYPAHQVRREVAVRQDRTRERGRRFRAVEAELLEQRQELSVANADLAEERAQTVALTDDGTEQRVEPAFAGHLQHCGKRLGKLGVCILRRKRDHFPTRLANEGSFHLRV